LKKVLTIVPYSFLPPKIGGQKCIALFLKFFSKYADITCISTINNDPNYADGYHLDRLFENSIFRYVNVIHFFRLRRIIHNKGISHIIIEHPYFGWLGILLQKMTGVKLIVHSHNIEANRFKSMNKWWWKILWSYERFTHRNADYNFFITDDDKDYGIHQFGLNADKCCTITYGTEINTKPTPEERNFAGKIITEKHAISSDEKILLFNGALDYKPNTDAIRAILYQINPVLLKQKDFKYKIIICGKNLPAEFNDLAEYKNANIIFAGFVDDISIYFKGADIFLNPVIEGGGIKTKLVEALGYNLSVVTTKSGATGVPVSSTGNKMKVSEDNNWTDFSTQILSINTEENIPVIFFEHFYWDNVAEKAAKFIDPYRTL
jgi:polysaccharide biosynthesis protein PslH